MRNARSTLIADADGEVNSPRSAPPTRSRWVQPAVLVVAVSATAVATWAVVRSPGDPGGQPGVVAVDGQRSDAAQSRVCDAFDLVRDAVSMQTNVDPGTDPAARAAVAANARLAALGGGEYLLSRLDPATPAALADPVRAFAKGIQDVGMNQLVGKPNSDPHVAALLVSAQEASVRIAQLCR